MLRSGKKLISLCTVPALVLSGCGSAPASTETTASEKPAPVSAVTSGTAAAQDREKTFRERAEEIVAGMTLEQKIAQMIMISCQYWNDLPATEENADKRQNVTSLNDDLKALLTKYDFGGFMLFIPNITGTEQTVRLTAEIQKAAMASEQGIPMFIATDQEGGDVTRLATGTRTCGNMALGAAGDTQAAYDNAAIIGSELYALGINTDLAPVIDVNNNPSNPVIGIRSFSSDPKLVSKLGISYIEGLESEGVISTVKHFPGHGDTDVDSHTGLPLIDKSLDELKELELIPFEAAADIADMVMTAHIQFPQIEKETYISKDSGENIALPATLSDTIISGILRGDLGYDGVVISDDMCMGAIKTNFDPVDAAVLAINSDVDILLDPMVLSGSDSIEAMDKYISDIASAVGDGRIPVSQIDDSVIRIISLKLEKGLFGRSADADEAAEKAKAVVGSEEHHDRELRIAEKAITLIKNEDNTLPLKMRETGIDFLCVPGHKGLLGPMGTGALLTSNLPLRPLLFGGTGTGSLSLDQPPVMPEMLESGTLNVPGIIGLGKGIETVAEMGVNTVYETETALCRTLFEGLRAIPGITVYGNGTDAPQAPLVSFDLEGRHSEDVASALADAEIAVRGGYHCAALAHRFAGTTETGTVRVSPSFANSQADINKLLNLVEKIAFYKNL